MGSFEDEHDRLRYVGGIVEQAPADDTLGPELVGTGITPKVVTSAPAAMARGQVTAEGRIGAPLTLVPSTTQRFPANVVLRLDGRDNLLEQV